MIVNPYVYLVFLAAVATLIVFIQKRTTSKIFDYLPAIVILYFSVMLLSSLGMWQKNSAITTAYSMVKDNLLPAMIFLMLLSSDIRQISALGKKMILTFLLASLSIGTGFIIMFVLLHTSFEPDAWKAFAALSGSWMGGTGNMVAIQGALNVPDSKMGYALLIDSIDYAIWVMMLLALVPFGVKFNHWTKSDTSIIDETSKKLAIKQAQAKTNFISLIILLVSAVLVTVTSRWLSVQLPSGDFFNVTTWMVIIATLAGILAAMTPLAKAGGSMMLGNAMLYLIVALIASRADFAELAQAPLYIIAGFMVIAVHAVIMVLFAKIFRLDLFSIGVASLANIGGVASAPILASAYSKALIPIGVLMAMMGYIIGTFGGLMVGKVLQEITL